jgi:hypothetical protein
MAEIILWDGHILQLLLPCLKSNEMASFQVVLQEHSFIDSRRGFFVATGIGGGKDPILVDLGARE